MVWYFLGGFALCYTISCIIFGLYDAVAAAVVQPREVPNIHGEIPTDQQGAEERQTVD